MLPNEKFCGHSHAQHVCRECAKLGAKELAYRQTLRDLDNCLTYEGTIRRRRRKTFEQFLNHEDPRIRECAKEILEEVTNSRFFPRIDTGQDDLLPDQQFEDLDPGEYMTECDAEPWEPEDTEWDTDVPF
jgi:hypothetical protein